MKKCNPYYFLLRDTLPGYFTVNTGAGIMVLITTKSILWVREQILWVLELVIQKSGLHKYSVLHIWARNTQSVNGMLTLALYKLLSGYNIKVS